MRSSGVLCSMWQYFPTTISGTICRSHLQVSVLTLDCLGFVSYCLVIYYQNVGSCGVGMSAALSNRFGDVTLVMVIICILNCGSCWSQRLHSLRRRSAAARLLRLWVRIPPGAWMSVCCECCVLSGRGLCDELITHPEESS